jgi:hypothetical protein
MMGSTLSVRFTLAGQLLSSRKCATKGKPAAMSMKKIRSHTILSLQNLIKCLFTCPLLKSQPVTSGHPYLLTRPHLEMLDGEDQLLKEM